MGDGTQNRYKSYDWSKPFDPAEYRGSSKAITMLYENWLEASSQLVETRREIEEIKKLYTDLDKSHAILSAEKEAAKKRRWTPFILQSVAVVCGGIGVNLLTGDTNKEYGWIFLLISLILEILAFIVVKAEA
ncbi:MAG: hypothetical protein IPP13_03120 [Kouleothrix sp.]|jgi:hypothetical protein|nr:hypothetical protein [Kouleothrix sp.]